MVVVRCQISDARCRSRRPVAHVEGPSAGMYTGGHPLEKHLKSPTLSHFWARPARRPEGKARSASRFRLSRSDLSRGVVGDQDTLWDRRPEKSLSISAYCSLPQAVVTLVFPGRPKV